MSLFSDQSSLSTEQEILSESTITMEEPTYLNSHLYFDEDGNEISEEEFRAQQQQQQEEEEDDEETWIKTPQIQQRFLLKHPRVILAFLRFVDLYNELADAEEVLMLPAIPQRVVNSIRNHSSIRNTPPEFQEDVDELLYRLDRHSDLSELSWV